MPSNESRLPFALLAVLVFLAAGFTLPPAESQGQLGVRVESIEFLGDPTAALTSRIRVTLVNDGDTTSGSLVLTYYWRVESDENYINVHNDSVRNRQESTIQLPLGVGAHQRLTTSGNTDRTWRPRDDQAVRQGGPGNVIVTVQRGECQLTGGCTNLASGSRPTYVRVPKVEIFADYTNPGRDSNGRFIDPTVNCDSRIVMKTSCKIAPGQSATFGVQIHNLGNFRDTYKAECPLCSEPDLPEGWYVNFTPSHGIPSNSTRKNDSLFYMVITAPRLGHENAEVNSGLNTGNSETLFVRVKSETNPSVDSDDVKKVALPHLLIRPTFVFNVSQGPPKAFGLTSQPIRVNFTVKNDGNGDDSYYVNLSKSGTKINANWSPVFSYDAANNKDFITIPRLAPGQSKNVTLTVVPPATTLRSVVPIDIHVQSNSTDQPIRDQKTMRFFVQVNQTFNITRVATGAGERSILAGDTARFEVRVRNNGNGHDNVTFSVESEQPQGGFSPRLSRSRLTIPPFSEASVFLNVSAIARTPANQYIVVFVNATAGGPSETEPEARSRVPFRFRVDTLRGSNIVLSTPDAPERFVDPKKNTSFTVEVRNVGNLEDNATIGVTRTSLEWRAQSSIECSALPGCLNLKPTDRDPKRLTLTVTAPDTQDVTSRSVSTIRVVPDSEPTRAATVNFTTRLSGPDLQVTGLVLDPPAIYTDRPATLTVFAGNGGNRGTSANVTLRVIATSGGTDRVLDERTLEEPAAGRIQPFVVNLNASQLALEGAVAFRAVIDPVGTTNPEGVVKEIDETNNQKQVSTFVRRLSFRVTAADGLVAHPGQTIAYADAPNAFVVENLGNFAEQVFVNVTSEHGWGESRTERILKPGERGVFSVTLRVPAVPTLAQDELTFELKVDGRPDYVRTAKAKTTLVDNDPPLILEFKATPREVTVGARTNLTARFEDALGIASAKVTILDPLNRSSVLTLRPVTPTVWATDQAFDVVGTFRATVEVQDRAERANVNSTVASPITFSVKAGSAPTIALGLDAKTPVRSGTGIPIVATDALGVGKVTYNLQGVDYPTSAPYEIDTKGLPSGSFTVIVTAENVFGVKASKTFTFLVDNAAPAKGTYTVSASEPVEGEEVTVTVRTESDVSKVTAAVKRDGVELETRELDRQGSGLFRLKYAPDGGSYALDFVLTDAAGNSRTDERAVAFEVKSGLLAPGFGAFLALAALGLALVLRRRR